MKKIITPLLLLSVGICFGMMLTRSCSKPKEITTEIVKTDTLTIVRVDTIVRLQPQPYKVEVRDTILLTDTIFIGGQMLFQEVKEYKDSTYYARISGINAYLEEIRVYPKTTTKYIFNTEIVREKPKKWGIGPQVGLGVVGNTVQPYIGIGIQYNLIRW